MRNLTSYRGLYSHDYHVGRNFCSLNGRLVWADLVVDWAENLPIWRRPRVFVVYFIVPITRSWSGATPVSVSAKGNHEYLLHWIFFACSPPRWPVSIVFSRVPLTLAIIISVIIVIIISVVSSICRHQCKLLKISIHTDSAMFSEVFLYSFCLAKFNTVLDTSGIKPDATR